MQLIERFTGVIIANKTPSQFWNKEIYNVNSAINNK